MTDILKELHGSELGLEKRSNLVTGKGKYVTHPAVDAAITVGAENANVRAISVQLKDANGENIAEIVEVDIEVLLDATGTAYAATGGSTGIADGGAGTVLAVVAKKLFKAKSSVAGLIELTWTDTGTEAAYLGVKLPSGRIVISDALTNT